MTVLDSLSNTGIANFGVVGAQFPNQQSVTFSLDAHLLVAPAQTQQITFLLNTANDSSGSSGIFIVYLQMDSNNVNWVGSINVGSYDDLVAPSSGSESFTCSGTTLSLTGTVTVASTDGSGTITLNTPSGTAIWDITSADSGGVFIGGTVDQILYWSIGYVDYGSQDYSTPALETGFTLSGSNTSWFDASISPPVFDNGSTSSTVSLTGDSFETPTETGIEYSLDGGSFVAAENFVLFGQSNTVTQATQGGRWTADGPLVSADNMTHQLVVRSQSNPADSVSGSFYSGGLFLTLDTISGPVHAGVAPAISGLEGEDISGAISYLLDFSTQGTVDGYQPATIAGGAWSGYGPTAAGGTHTLQVSWGNTDSTGGSTYVQSNTITYSVTGTSYAGSNIMIL